MPNSWFRFKQFMIQQEHAAMKVGTDGVLLGAWTSVPESGSRILDVGTGTGLIALMLAQRTKNAKVDALEIDPASASQARENFRNSPWSERLHCIRIAFQDYASRCTAPYDLIVCNPPFFTASTKTPSRGRTLARHDTSLSLEELFKGCISLMKQSTILSLVLPVQKEEQVLALIYKNHLSCSRLTRVIPSPGKPAKRLLLEISSTSGNPIQNNLTIEAGKRHNYTEAYLNLVKEFYL